MATYNKKTVSQITALIEDGNHSISTICKIVGIGRKTFYDWKNARPDFVAAIEEAEQRRSEELYELANKGLKRKLEGYYETVSRTVYVPSPEDSEQLEIKQHVVTRKFCEPDAKLLLDVLGYGVGKRKKKGGRVKGVNPALVVKKAEGEIKENLSQIPPFTIKAKEVVEQTLKSESKEYLECESDVKDVNGGKVEVCESPKSEEPSEKTSEKTSVESKTEIDNKPNIHKKYEPVPPPVPPGYTRRA